MISRDLFQIIIKSFYKISRLYSVASSVLLDCAWDQYGADCGEYCSKYCKNSCDQYTGVCLNGCLSGYKMPYCRESEIYYDVLCPSVHIVI